MPRADAIHIRDPFVLRVDEERAYYLYGTTDENCWEGPATGFDCYRSLDLIAWEGPFPAFRPPLGFWSDRNFWAPEVHRYGGRYLMLASFYAEGRRRGTQALASDRPSGPFELLGEGPVTPSGWDCLDGTLYVDEGERPWLVFCREWLQVCDGEIYAAPLSPDLRALSSAPERLFSASQAPWTRGMKHPSFPEGEAFVTDGPFLYRSNSGELLLLWSSQGEAGYAMGLARSASGSVLGPWKHDARPLFGRDGGHGMLFRTFDGRLTLALHAPNETPYERPRFIEVEEGEGGIEIPRCR